MPQPSTIDRLPPEIKLQLQQLLQDPRVTQLEATARINAILEEEGHEERLTKSSVGRAAQRWSKIGDRLRQSREVGEMFIAKVGAAPQGQTGLMINEILRTLAYELSEKLLDADLEDAANLPAIIDQVKALALAVQRLEQSATINVKREGEIRKLALQQAADVVEKAAIQKGMNAEEASFWRQQVLGVQ